jgi:hypothetical protein
VVGGAFKVLAIEGTGPVRGGGDGEDAVDVDAGEVEVKSGLFEQATGADDSSRTW